MQPRRPASEMERLLLEAISNLSQLCVMVSDYQSQGDDPYFSRINLLLRQLHDLQKVPPEDYDMELSPDVVRVVDAGYSPAVYLAGLKSGLTQRLRQAKGKIFERHLDEAIQKLESDGVPVDEEEEEPQ